MIGTIFVVIMLMAFLGLSSKNGFCIAAGIGLIALLLFAFGGIGFIFIGIAGICLWFIGKCGQ